MALDSACADPTPQPRRLLVWRAGALGDTLTLFPALDALRRRYPTVRLDAVGTPANLELARQAGLVDRVWDAGDPLFGRLFQAPGQAGRAGGTAPALVSLVQEIDLAIIWSGAAQVIESNLRHLGVPAVLAARPTPIGSERMTAYLLRCLSPLGIAGEPLVMPLLQPERAAYEATDEAWRGGLRAAGGHARAVVLHAGAGSPVKRWPVQSFLALAGLVEAKGWSVLWTCGPADGDVRQVLARAGVAPATVFAGWTLPHLGALLARGTALVSSDSGVAHLGAALGLPTVVLFGPTDERVWAPLGPRVAVLRERPCGRPPDLPGVSLCPAEPCCLRALAPERVARTVEQLCASNCKETA